MKNKCIGLMVVVALLCGLLTLLPPTLAGVDWPPKLNQPYPDLELVDQTGQPVKLADFKGSVILVEYIGMTCPACQAFAGAHRRGSFGNIKPQNGLKSIEEYFPRYTNGLSLSDKRIVFVQILLYDMSMQAPGPDDARKWARHFKLDRSRNRIVLAGKKELLGTASYNLIPGFQLIAKDFTVRSDSTGHHPRHNLYTELLPMVPQLLRERSASVDRPSASRDLVALSKTMSMSVAEAYKAIPHRRTVFDVRAANMASPERAFLDEFFQLVDLAMVERVQTLSWLSTDRRKRELASHYDEILSRLAKQDVPRSLRKVHRLVREAITAQREFLEAWQKAGGRRRPNIGGDPRVQKASGNLRRAYSLLMELYPREGAHNKQAFFDYLCALDFI